ncbi:MULTISPECIES: ABC transporter ATP-binding protein [Mammaliicoccus]|uniref:ABC transporter ATP-binding protein n=1 Tax=Mammaliicoccus fleurettii TaxID=150056 RepID=A0ABS5MLB7_9STAP|nr:MULTISPECIES: ABC transporter ATP-binding protein [Mammaliicoccus]MBL0847078.1 ABC transporter ATP-binding protein [Mammaliicoccus fleurettii]MBO3063194.1 ABC transporter ATP-binding protein [Mammaliicoccus fleurettii]MBS3671802.1 ABC transporter ATP-binding protein [Mammaliicoccus fleurettii]MBS3696700.1 ABC transporter ATP-binding protein [Mammaliicoccus fleurettii]MBW0763804.1 ABC transporter ATP-binding protein [Mammaliicoccus fleurettii]
MIQVKNLNKQFNGEYLFTEFNLSVNKGEMIAITGKSGSGKSTLLACMCGLEKFDKGKIEINKRNIANMKQKDKVLIYRNEIGYLFQNYALISHETINYNLEIVLSYKKLSKAKKKELKLEALNKVGLDKSLDTKVYTLSGGEQQRVAIARLLLKEPLVIFADEPTGALDEVNKHIILKLLLEFKGKSTIIIVTHDEEVMNYCDRNIQLSK